jgi:shikimate dehydrogenase
VRELRDEAKVDPDRVTVVGAGGAARAALTALEALGLSAEVVARDPVRASALAAEFGAEVRDPTVGSPASLFIHATPAGRRECPELGIPLLRLVGRDSYILDFVHAPLHRFLEERAARHGARYEDGRALLAYQAAESFALWWGVPVDPQELKRAARGGS